ncbi:hypothetical protein [Candidatus Cyrtobacter comes]|uniref:hypothetical protein n=1 Tax=Candidatus Cyrtobacter comes TaxID=675776 RepID=UPI002ACE2841|nr:hypothetical protein [Candidatus Cyrtobacter comes]
MERVVFYKTVEISTKVAVLKKRKQMEKEAIHISNENNPFITIWLLFYSQNLCTIPA